MGGETKRVVVTKSGESPPPPDKAKATRKASQTAVKKLPVSQHRTKTPKHGILKHGKTARKTPRFEGVKDPAASPPIRSTRRGLRILTEKGMATRRAKIADDAKRKPIREIRETLKKHNLNVNEKTPEHLAREIYKDAQFAGMIVSG